MRKEYIYIHSEKEILKKKTINNTRPLSIGNLLTEDGMRDTEI